MAFPLPLSFTLAAFCVHSHTHMLAETEAVPTQTLSKQCSPTDKSLPSQGSKYLCHMAGVGGRTLRPEILTLPVNHSAPAAGRTSLNAE